MKKKMVAVLLLSSMVFAGCAKEEEAPAEVEPVVETTEDTKEEAKQEEEK